MLETIKDIARRAGAAILEIYEGEMGVTYKEDDSPLTLADRAAHKIIEEGLTKLAPEIPVISEEGLMPSYEERQKMTRFFLVDPLDGTKEFIKRNDEFTVNIALIENNVPVAGVVYIPVEDKLYAACPDTPAVMEVGDNPPVEIMADASYNAEGLRVSMSRSHPNERLTAYLEQFPNLAQQPLGSALKFCMIAENKIDFYPRFGPLMEWDTAAAHAVVARAGVVIKDLEGKPLEYNKEVMKHFGLIAAAGDDLMDYLQSKI